MSIVLKAFGIVGMVLGGIVILLFSAELFSNLGTGETGFAYFGGLVLQIGGVLFFIGMGMSGTRARGIAAIVLAASCVLLPALITNVASWFRLAGSTDGWILSITSVFIVAAAVSFPMLAKR